MRKKLSVDRFTGFDHVESATGEGEFYPPFELATTADLAALKAAVEGGLSLKLSRTEAASVVDGAINHYYKTQGRAMYDAEKERVEKMLEDWWDRRRPYLMDDVKALIPRPSAVPWVTLALAVACLVATVALVRRIDAVRGLVMAQPKPVVQIQPAREAANEAARVDWTSVGGEASPSAPFTGVRTEEPEIKDASPKLVWAGHVDVRYRVDKLCWVDINGFGGMVKAGGGGSLTSDHPVEIRAGCPGAMHYEVDGREARPANLSRTPGKSERVVLP